MYDFTSVRNHPERSFPIVEMALSRGRPLGRAMTYAERLLLGVLHAEPTHFLTLHSAVTFPPVDVTAAWSRLARRWNRQRLRQGRAKPLICIVAPATTLVRAAQG